jgi:hypothetical protein
MLFAKGLSNRLFATHPPLVERIRAIEPRFDPRELESIALRMGQQGQALRAERETSAPPRGASVSGAEGATFAAETLLGRMGQPSPAGVMAAERLAASIPTPLERAAHRPEWAREVIGYLLMSLDPEIRERQLMRVSERLGPDSERQVGLLLREVPTLAPALRMPLLEICFPALRRRPEPDLVDLKILVDELIEADGQVSLFEYALARSLTRYLEDLASPSTARVGGHGKLTEATPEVLDLLGILAHHGRGDRALAHAALLAGIKRLGAKPEALERIKEDWLESEWLDQGWSVRLDAALDKLGRLRLEDKQRLLGAMMATVLADGRVAVAELELLRVICSTLRMPLPVLEPALFHPYLGGVPRSIVGRAQWVFLENAMEIVNETHARQHRRRSHGLRSRQRHARR